MRGLYMAEGAMLNQQAKLEISSNNLANQRTPGFKKDGAAQTSFAEWLIVQTGREMPTGRSGMMPVGTMAHNVAIDEEYTQLAQGNLEPTGRGLDLALYGEGFFEVEVDGEAHYTRNGHFFLDEDGVLVDVEGNPVQGTEGPITLGMEDFEVTAQGEIYQEEELIDQLELVNFDPEANLTKVGDNYLVPEDPGAEGMEAEVQVFQGFLEGANVDLAEEMTNLIKTRQSFEGAQRVMSTYDSFLERAANDLGVL